MTSAHLLASGPVKLRATSLQSCRDRRVHRVVDCSNQQRDSTLKWGRKPATKVQAVSEEVIEGLASHSTHDGNGVSPKTAPVTQSTLSVHAGESGGRPKVADSLTTPICCTSTYYFQDTAELIAYQEGRYGSYEYGRSAFHLYEQKGCCLMVRGQACSTLQDACSLHLAAQQCHVTCLALLRYVIVFTTLLQKGTLDQLLAALAISRHLISFHSVWQTLLFLLRYGNPTTRVVEEKIKELEGAEDCLVSSSGTVLPGQTSSAP